jgi:prepilin-type N-terminal cleavage/methylation domain-containing protein/prepilin-type processing-associated H-X9-DG protein
MRVHCRNRAFTLVELLVVIGIIAALIGILLPVLSGVQARGRDIKCQSNIRQICQAIIGYATESKGVMPYGFYWNRSNPVTWANEDPENRFVSWASLVGKYMVRRGADGDNEEQNFPPVLQCPEALQARPHVVGYVMNFIVGVTPLYELQVGSPPSAQLVPPKQTLMTKETALIWDTAVRPNWENNVGHLTGADIDGERFWQGADIPQYRYYRVHDPFSRLPPGTFGNNKPVQLDVGQYVYKNIDPGTSDNDADRFPYQGNLRFRHGKGTQCNVGFADGSVRQFTAKFKSDKTLQDNSPLNRSHDALRRYFMIKWPPGVPAKPGTP